MPPVLLQCPQQFPIDITGYYPLFKEIGSGGGEPNLLTLLVKVLCRFTIEGAQFLPITPRPPRARPPAPLTPGGFGKKTPGGAASRGRPREPWAQGARRCPRLRRRPARGRGGLWAWRARAALPAGAPPPRPGRENARARARQPGRAASSSPSPRGRRPPQPLPFAASRAPPAG
ncbi:unnamed protein product [Rangifer tarandus platyrhynchus]|uniref:Uncharacterized protein n=1 Tax=Rangifer tarandus platyrhynchus TaxID=3082113 RepID=A0AC59Z9C3_RANTA